MGINGKYYAKSITTSVADQDLVTTMETALDEAEILIKKLTLISSSEFTVSINGNEFSDMYKDTDNLYKMSLDAEDVIVESLVIHESGITIFLAMVY